MTEHHGTGHLHCSVHHHRCGVARACLQRQRKWRLRWRLSHPVFGPDHVAAMVAVGLWGAFLGAPAIYVLPVVFPRW
jgi:hydrogenase/urease accessory protein HupE